MVEIERRRFDAGLPQPLERPGDERPPGDRQEWLRDRRSERTQPLAAAGGENQGAQARTPHRIARRF
jgi:hypothetical protein